MFVSRISNSKEILTTFLNDSQCDLRLDFREVFYLKIMAENKKSFVAYCDWQETFESLTDEEAGRLIKHIFNYVNDKNPETTDKLTQMCFIPIKQCLKRDLKKYESYVEKQKVNGAKGGRPKKTEKTQPFLEKPKKADNVNDNDNVNDINNKLFKEIILKDQGYLETVSMQFKINIKTAKHYVDKFYRYVVLTDDNKNNLSEFKSHFTRWLNKQEIEIIKEDYVNPYNETFDWIKK